jgi:hypothetical protein
MEEKMEVGVDISKLKFDVVLINQMGKSKHNAFINDAVGFNKFKDWLNSFDALSAHVCMEATGRYGENLALFLSNNSIKVSVVNPCAILPATYPTIAELCCHSWMNRIIKQNWLVCIGCIHQFLIGFNERRLLN